MTIEVRAIGDDEISTFRVCAQQVFGFPEAPDMDKRFAALVDLSRTFAAFDGDELVGTAATFEFDLTVPGGTIAMAGLTNVSVKPTHRRQGIMSSMVRAHLSDAKQRGEPASGLWCSEAAIYQRYGYGAVGESDVVRIDTQRMRIVSDHDADTCLLVDDARAREVLPGVFDRVRSSRPGMLTRSEAWWHHRRFCDPSEWRAGASAKLYAITMRGDEPTGYMVYRQRAKFSDGVASGTIEIVELQAIDAQAEVSLWRLVTNMDLFPTVKWWNAPADSVLPWVVDDMRCVQRKRLDHLWLMISDVPAAMSARSYTLDGSLNFRVQHGDQAADYQLDVVYGSGACSASQQPPELHMDLAALGSIYLGGVSPRALARAGRIIGDDAAVTKAERMFSWDIAPWCPEIF